MITSIIFVVGTWLHIDYCSILFLIHIVQTFKVWIKWNRHNTYKSYLFIPELRECINNDTKHNIETNSGNYDEEGYIIEKEAPCIVCTTRKGCFISSCFQLLRNRNLCNYHSFFNFSHIRTRKLSIRPNRRTVMKHWSKVSQYLLSASLNSSLNKAKLITE